MIYSNWQDDADIKQLGVFAEWRYSLNDVNSVVSGYRWDRWQATDQRQQISGMMSSVPNPTANHQREDNLHSGFVRLEQKISHQPASWYLGFGSTNRFPDYWELIAKEAVNSKSAFDSLKAEQTNQLDLGYLYKDQHTEWSASAFYNQINNFILVDYSLMMKTNGAVRNIQAQSYGAELGVQHKLNPFWKTEATLAYVRGDNNSDHTPLAQLSPLELKLGLSYARDNWSVGSLLRLVDGQNRYDLNKGTIVGKDLGPSSGFAIYSVNGSWRPIKSLLLTAGVDNLFDRNYAEFVSRAGGNGMGGAIPGYIQTLRVNEPGRTAWLKLQWQWEGVL